MSVRIALRLALLAGLGALAVYRADGERPHTDLTAYLAGAQRVRAGEDPLGAHNDRGWPYIYPPTLAVFAVPLTYLPLRVAAAIWFLAGALALAWGSRACRAALGRAGDLTRVDYIAWLLVFAPAASSLLRGQVGPLLLGLCGAGILALHQRRDIRAGLLFSLAAAIKITPGLLLVGLVVAGRTRAWLASLAGLVVWLLIVPAPFLGVAGAAKASIHVGRVVVLGAIRNPRKLEIQHEVQVGTNQSLTSQIVRRTFDPLQKILVLGLGFGLVGLCLPLVRRHLYHGFALLLAVPLLVAPIAWHHHHILLFAVLLALSVQKRIVPLVVFAAASALHFGFPVLRPCGLLGWGTLVVVSALAWRCWRTPRPGPANPAAAPPTRRAGGRGPDPSSPAGVRR